MIRIVVVDDHPALRAGLQTVLQAEPGLVPVGDADAEDALWPLLHRVRPDLVLLDYHLERSDGLQLCYAIKHEVTPPRVLLYSAYASTALAVPAMVAGADGVANKGLGARALFDVVRQIARGQRCLPELSRGMLDEAYGRISADDSPVLGMLLDGASVAEIGEILGVPVEQVHHRVKRMLHDLRVDVAVVD